MKNRKQMVEWLARVSFLAARKQADPMFTTEREWQEYYTEFSKRELQELGQEYSC